MLKPMLAHKVDAPFDDEQTIVEPKMDGFRLLLSTKDGLIEAHTRHGNEVKERFPLNHKREYIIFVPCPYAKRRS